jgi:Tfp pilus assembly protein PilV
MGRQMFQSGKVRGSSAGFGLIDTLVALLLLSVALLGVGTSLIQSMRASHAATLQTLAVDLAADLAEDLQSARTDAEVTAAIDNWQLRVPAALPVTVLVPAPYALALLAAPTATPNIARYDLLLRWRDPTDKQAVTLAMPAASTLPVAMP